MTPGKSYGRGIRAIKNRRRPLPSGGDFFMPDAEAFCGKTRRVRNKKTFRTQAEKTPLDDERPKTCLETAPKAGRSASTTEPAQAW